MFVEKQTLSKNRSFLEEQTANIFINNLFPFVKDAYFCKFFDKKTYKNVEEL